MERNYRIIATINHSGEVKFNEPLSQMQRGEPLKPRGSERWLSKRKEALDMHRRRGRGGSRRRFSEGRSENRYNSCQIHKENCICPAKASVIMGKRSSVAERLSKSKIVLS